MRRGVVSHILPGPSSTGNRNLSHHPVACLDGFIILPRSVLFLQDHQACKSNVAFSIQKEHAPNPKRACMRISFGAWQIQRCYHFNTPKFLVHGSKDIQRLQDASRMMQHYHRFISSHCNCMYFAQQKLELWLFRPSLSTSCARSCTCMSKSAFAEIFSLMWTVGQVQPALTSRKPFISLIQPEAKMQAVWGAWNSE